jgi:hypothetical protein
MGCDIHLAVEHKIDGVWQQIDPPDDFPRDPWIIQQIKAIKGKSERILEESSLLTYYENKLATDWYSQRNYYAFAILANVRHDHFNPISLPKGLPNDLSEDLKTKDCLGEHSFSWLTVKEMIDFDWNQTVENTGIINWETFVERMEKGITSEPESYCANVIGNNIKIISESDALGKYKSIKEHDLQLLPFDYRVKIKWKQTYADAAGAFMDVLEYLKKIDKNPENVRIVFGFDS